MTKMKSKKMTKSTFAIIIMGIVMVAMLAFGGTFAYFTATSDKASATITTGKVQLGANTITSVKGNIVSGQQIVSAVTVESKSDVDTWIFVTFSVGGIEGVTASASKEAYNTATGEAYFLEYAVETGWTAVTGKTNVFGRKVDANTAKAISVCSSVTFWGKSASTTAGGLGSLMGKTIEISLASESIQDFSETTQAAFADAAAAYAALHG